MPRVDIQKLRHECQRILAYTEDLTTDALQRDTSLGDAIFLRIERLYDLAFAALCPFGPHHEEAPQAQSPLFSQIEPAETPRALYARKDEIFSDLARLREELLAAQAKVAQLEAAAATAPQPAPELAQVNASRPAGRESAPQAAHKPAPELVLEPAGDARLLGSSQAALHLRVVPQQKPVEDENMTFLGLAKK